MFEISRLRILEFVHKWNKMEKSTMFRILVLIALCLYSAVIFAQLTVHNYSDKKVYIAIGFYENGEWYSEGWWSIEPYDFESGSNKRRLVSSPNSVTLRGSLSNRYYYIHAHGGDLRWSGKNKYPVQKKRFKKRKYINDKISCPPPYYLESFKKVDTGSKSSEHHIYLTSWVGNGLFDRELEYQGNNLYYLPSLDDLRTRKHIKELKPGKPNTIVDGSIALGNEPGQYYIFHPNRTILRVDN